MPKLLTALLGAALMAMFLVACSSSTPNDDNVTPPPDMMPMPPDPPDDMTPDMMEMPPAPPDDTPPVGIVEFNVLKVRDAVGGSVQLSREGTDIIVTATPDAGYVFGEWQCTSRRTCPLTEFDSPAVTLTSLESLATIYPTFNAMAAVSLSETENGSATADCAPECTDAAGWSTRISAMPDEGYRFVRWDCLGAATCMEFNNRFDATAELTVNGDVTLTPVYELMARIQLTVQSSEGGSVTFDTECGDDCNFGIGWVAVLQAVPDDGYLFSGWRCVGAGDCPSEITESRSRNLRFSPTENITITAEFNEAPSFYVTSTDIFVPGSVPLAVAESVICSDGGCIHIVGGDTARLVVIGSDSGASYQWSVIGDSSHLDIPISTAQRVNLSVADDIRGVVVSELEVVATSSSSGTEQRTSVTVVAIPPALALRVGTVASPDLCSGSVIERAGKYYALTAAHCFDLSDPFDVEDPTRYASSASVRYGVPGMEQTVVGEIIGIDEVGDVAVVSIPDPRLPWVPTVARSLIEQGSSVQVVGVPGAADFTSTPGNRATVVTEGRVARVRDECELIFTLGPSSSLEIEGFSRCEVSVIETTADIASSGSSGSPMLNSGGEIIGVLTGAEASSIGATSIGTVFQFSTLLDDILGGGKRCLEVEIEIDEISSFQTYVGVRGCDFEE